MSAIRVIIQSNEADGAETFAERTAVAMARGGCLQHELYRGLEFPQHLIQLELWDSAEAFDRHWLDLLKQEGLSLLGSTPDGLCAPYHAGHPLTPREHGHNGIEIYPHSWYERKDNVWAPVAGSGSPGAARWPARSAIRILVMSVLSPDRRGHLMPGAVATRLEKGCQQFEYFQSAVDENRLLLAELWDTPANYDEHYLLRVRQQRAAGPSAAPVPENLEFEWYQHGYFARAGGVWLPENPSERMSMVRW